MNKKVMSMLLVTSFAIAGLVTVISFSQDAVAAGKVATKTTR